MKIVMGLSRTLNPTGIRHANADSTTHARHVSERKMQRQINWVPNLNLEENAAEIFKLKNAGLNEKGRYYIKQGDSEASVSGAQFEVELAKINNERGWQWGKLCRDGKESRVKRKRNKPALNEFVVNLSPWQMVFINRRLAEWEAAGVSDGDRGVLLMEILTPLRQSVVEKFQAESGRVVAGSYIHLDSNKVHFGVIHTRVNADHTLAGVKSLHTVGPWSVAQYRISSIGGVDAGDTRLVENLSRFRERNGEVIPMDIAVHQGMDLVFEQKVIPCFPEGEKEYADCKKEYLQWKTKERDRVLWKQGDATQVIWRFSQILLPFLAPELQAGIRVCRTGIQILQFVQEFQSQGQSVAFEKQKEKSIEM